METDQLTSRKIRVFLSSTFQDMQLEREYLVKHTFPAIKAVAEKRQVDFSVVDLRWGVTEEDVHQGKVIEICLNEITETNPFFIGLIGNRYGWCPSIDDFQKNKHLQISYPMVGKWIEDGLSVTEMEMRYGVLNSIDSKFAHFFLKQKTSQNKFTTEEEIKLQKLRISVQDRAEEGICYVHSYDNVKDLGDEVYQSLLTILNELYPQNELDPKTQLLKRQCYLVHQKQHVYCDESTPIMLDTFVELGMSSKGCLLAYSETGTGKTALICNWRKESPKVIRTLLNDIDNSAEIAMQHFFAELESRNLRADEVIWIIDGLEHLLKQSDRSLEWLTDKRLINTNLFLTTNDEILAFRATELAKKNKWQFYNVIPGFPYGDELKSIICKYLKQYAKCLSEEQLEYITSYQWLNDYQLLITFLHELVQFGHYDTLDTHIESYLCSQSHSELIKKILCRIRDDYGEEATAIFFNILSLTKYGLPEGNLQELLGFNNIQWAGFRESIGCLIVQSYDMIALTSLVKSEVPTCFPIKNVQEISLQHKIVSIYKKILTNKTILPIKADLIRQYVKLGKLSKNEMLNYIDDANIIEYIPELRLEVNDEILPDKQLSEIITKIKSGNQDNDKDIFSLFCELSKLEDNAISKKVCNKVKIISYSLHLAYYCKNGNDDYVKYYVSKIRSSSDFNMEEKEYIFDFVKQILL